jgi:hypothetical protein
MALNRYVLGVVAGLCLAFTCAAKPQSVPPKEARMKKPAMIEEQVLRDSRAQGASVALVRVAKLEPHAQGTRSAKVYIHLEVERLLQGELPRQVHYWVWGSLETVKLAPRLMIATHPPFPDSSEIEPLAVVEVPDGLVEESVQAHQQALQKLGKPPAPGR